MRLVDIFEQQWQVVHEVGQHPQVDIGGNYILGYYLDCY